MEHFFDAAPATARWQEAFATDRLSTSPPTRGTLIPSPVPQRWAQTKRLYQANTPQLFAWRTAQRAQRCDPKHPFIHPQRNKSGLAVD